MSHVPPGTLPSCLLHPPEHINHSLLREGSAHHPPGLRGAEQPTQDREEPSSQSFQPDSPSLCCLVPGGSRCCLELFIISLTLDLAAFKPLWPRDPKPTPQRSHPASIQLCAEASATSPRVQVSVSVPVKGNTVLSPLTSMRVQSGSPDHLYVCHSIKQAACSLQPASL